MFFAVFLEYKNHIGQWMAQILPFFEEDSLLFDCNLTLVNLSEGLSLSKILLLSAFDGTWPVTVVLTLSISTKLKIDSLLCDEGKIVGTRLLEPATNCSLVRVAFTLDEALCGWNAWLRFI